MLSSVFFKNLITAKCDDHGISPIISSRLGISLVCQVVFKAVVLLFNVLDDHSLSLTLRALAAWDLDAQCAASRTYVD